MLRKECSPFFISLIFFFSYKGARENIQFFGLFLTRNEIMQVMLMYPPEGHGICDYKDLLC